MIMPFLHRRVLAGRLTQYFNVGRNKNTTFESHYYDPCNRLFNYDGVEGSFNFFLPPHTIIDETSAVNFVVLLVGLNQEQKPDLIAEIKDDIWKNILDKRQRGDTQMRQRYDQMLPNCPIPRLYGLSLLGTSLRVYCRDKFTGKIAPVFVGRSDVDYIFPSDFLAGQWNLDIFISGWIDKDARNCCIYQESR